MRSKHRNSRRRYSGRRRSERTRSKIAIFLIILFVIAVVVGSVFLGNHLKEKAEISEADRLSTESITERETDTEKASILYPVHPPRSLEVEYLPRGNIGSYEGTGENVSITLRNNAGELYYSSPSAQTLGGQSSGNGLMTAEEIIGSLKEKNCYVSVSLGIMGHSDETGATTEAVHAFEIALIGEIATAGADEILLCGFEDMDAERVGMLCQLSSSFRSTAKTEVPMGILLPYSFFADKGANELCKSLAEHFEFLAVDYTSAEAPENETAVDRINSMIDSMQMYLSRYSLRVVLDYKNDNPEEAKAAVFESAIYSVQTLDTEDIFAVRKNGADDTTE